MFIGSKARRHLAVAGGLIVCLLAACGNTSPATTDADVGPLVRDASVIDAVSVTDASSDAVTPPMPEAAPPLPMPTCDIGACDPREPGCDGGMVCELRRGTTECSSEISTGLSEGENCFAPHDCAAGLICSIGRTVEAGICRRPCCPLEDEGLCGEGRRCAFPARDPATAIAWSWGRCVPPRPCDPLAPERVCNVREACYIVAADGATDCMNRGWQAAGESCERQSDCDQGLYCARSGSRLGMCVRVCSLSDNRAACPIGEGSCVEYAHTPEGLGLCTLAARAG